MDVPLPPLLPYPSEDVRAQLLPDEWTSCLDLWIRSINLRLSLPDSIFMQAGPEDLGTKFLSSYCSGNSYRAKSGQGSREADLHKLCFYLCKRLILTDNGHISPELLFQLMGGGSMAFMYLKTWKQMLKTVWKSQQKQAREAIESAKSRLGVAKSEIEQQTWLSLISALTQCLPEAATVTVASADYLDTLADIYMDGSMKILRSVTQNVYYSFLALLDTKHIMILTDNIYHMKSDADRLLRTSPATTTILSSLLCSTTFLKHFGANTDIATRKQALVDQLTKYRHDMLHLHPSVARPRKKKEKEKAMPTVDMHMHRASLVSQVHELFPELSTNYILKALDAYGDNVENVIAGLLEPASLPSELKDQTTPDMKGSFNPDIPDLEPRSAGLLSPDHKVGFDKDDFDNLAISPSQLRRGKKRIDPNEQVSSTDHARSKAAILSALAAFDSDDDERDDSYDVADVGASVDTTVDTDERRSQDNNDAHEEALFKSWKEQPGLFARDSKTRSGILRLQLKRETGMSDEQIEGWGIVLSRDKKMQDHLQDKYSSVRAFSGQQKLLQSTRWQATTSTENSETEGGPDESNDSRRMGQAGIRGHRNFNGRGGVRGNSSTGGASGDAKTQQARRRKEQGRGRGGANQRRDARAKKIGRGMGPMPQG